MYFTIGAFGLSMIAMIYMVVLKVREIDIGEKGKVSTFISRKFDPIAGHMVGFYNSITVSSFGRSMTLVGAKLGIITAKFLFYLKNKFSKIAAHLYHHSRKIEANSTNQPSFFIKTIKEYKENLQNGNPPSSAGRRTTEGQGEKDE